MNSITPQFDRRRSGDDGSPHDNRSTPYDKVRSQPTRAIHLLLLLLVIHQLVGSQLMERPFPGDAPAWPYRSHEYAGLASLAIVAVFWIWTMVRRGETRLERLLPWFSLARLKDVLADAILQTRRLMRTRAPDDKDGALASAVHGLGVLVVTAMALTGAVFYFTSGTPVARTSIELHKLLANLMWAYLVAHAGLAALHHLLGSDIFSRMFWVARHRRPQQARPPSGPTNAG